jgi:hypothetical protein
MVLKLDWIFSHLGRLLDTLNVQTYHSQLNQYFWECYGLNLKIFLKALLPADGFLRGDWIMRAVTSSMD